MTKENNYVEGLLQNVELFDWLVEKGTGRVFKLTSDEMEGFSPENIERFATNEEVATAQKDSPYLFAKSNFISRVEYDKEIVIHKNNLLVVSMEFLKIPDIKSVQDFENWAKHTGEALTKAMLAYTGR